MTSWFSQAPGPSGLGMIGRAKLKSPGNSW